MRTIIAIAVALTLVVAGCSQAPGAGTEPVTDGTADTTAASTQSEATQEDGQEVVKPDDPEADVLGWEDGIWYNETIAVTPGDGLNETELNGTVSRAMARVERIRGLEFQRRVPVEIVTRQEFQARQDNRSTPSDRRTFDNAKFEALFMIDESTDSIAVQNRNSGSTIGGFYSPTEDRIVVVSENGSTPKLNELTLGHELMHALQHQQFDLSRFNQSTRELHNAKDGLIEGDSHYVEYLYRQRCADEWNGDCLTPDGGSSSAGGLANIGPYLLKYQPYSDGPAFVQSVRQEGGWQAVNDLYGNPPQSTEQIIHHDKYGEDAPAEFGIADRSSGGWERLKLTGRPSYASVGETGIFSMFMYPYYDSQGQTQIVDSESFFNRKGDSNELRKLDPLNYTSTYSDGWDGDKLAVYTNADAPENETGYVWKTVWDSERDASEFVEGYRKLLRYNGATRVDGRANTWRIEGDGFGDAFYVEQRGDTVVIVNAPSVEELSNVREGAAPKQ